MRLRCWLFKCEPGDELETDEFDFIWRLCRRCGASPMDRGWIPHNVVRRFTHAANKRARLALVGVIAWIERSPCSRCPGCLRWEHATEYGSYCINEKCPECIPF